ncbi:MAG: ATP-binding protein [Pyrinomonadaceae bacterium]
MTEELSKWPPTFSLDGPSIMDLLTGDRFYSSADAALREAVLNAIDACGRRLAEDANYHRSITVAFDEGTRTLMVTDNGDGMDQHDITELFTKIGASASRAIEKTSRGSYAAVGEFGIGIVSYFLVCQRFEVHTRGGSGAPIGLVFANEMFNMEKSAEEITCRKEERGTTIILHVIDQQRFDLLVAKFPHWVRDVPYLSASSSARGVLPQGGRRRHVTPVPVPEPAPDWVEKAELGPPVEIDYWRALDGNAHVDVLYRGVFVQELNMAQLWGIEGSLHVNPKQFKPKLNRESFIAEGFDTEIQNFLRHIHPTILEAALENMRAALTKGEQDGWGLSKWITVWLAIPRGGAYAPVAEKWDEEFQNMRAFRQLSETSETLVSLTDIVTSGADHIYIVPNPLDSASLVGRKAISVLRARGAYIIQGLQRDSSFLTNTSLVAATTAELLLSHFRSKLPQIVNIEEVAHELIRDEQTLAEIFPTDPKVQLVRLGTTAAPVARIGGALWVNAESEHGRAILLDICQRNEGYLGLLVAVQQHAPQHINEVVQHLQGVTNLSVRLGPVRRQFLRGFAK